MTNQLLQHLESQGWTVNQPATFSTCLAEAAFKKAIELTKSIDHGETFSKWQGGAKIDDVIQSLKDSENKYVDRGNSKAWKWARRLSSKIMFYGQILDVIAQHHPEYVALAWGTIKFLLVGVINYETLVKELCKAFCRVADALQHVQLSSILYPSQGMQEHIARLYAHIMEFATRAIKWYEKRRVMKVLSALTSPFQLKFRDTVEDILDTVRSIDRMALSMSQVELRQIRLEMIETHKLAKEIKSSLEAYNQVQYSGLIDTNRRLSEVQFSQILAFIANSPLLDPALIRHQYASRRKLRRRGGRPKYHPSLSCAQLQQWGEASQSSQVLIQGSFRERHLTRDIAIDMIDLISNAGVPVVWALDPTLGPASLFTSVDVLKYITSQILRLNHTMLNERSAALNSARFQSVTTESEWFTLLGSAMEGLRYLYVIIDMELVNRSEKMGFSWLTEFPRLFESPCFKKTPIVVKVAFISPLGTKLDESGEISESSMIKISSKSSMRVRKSSASDAKLGKGNARKGKKKLLAALQRGYDGAATSVSGA